MRYFLFCFFTGLFFINLLTGCVPAMLAGTATTISLVHDRRSPGAVIDDKGIEIKALHEISKQPFFKKSHLNFISYDGQVLIVGQIPNAAAKKQCGQIVDSLAKVNKVFNELSIAEPSSLFSRSKDSWITGKITSRLLTHKNIDHTRIKVITENGIVYLMGIVSQQESALATQIIQQVSGVRKITRLFVYGEFDTSSKKTKPTKPVAIETGLGPQAPRQWNSPTGADF